MSYKNISYTISHIFVMLFMYVFIAHRYSKPKTAMICLASFLSKNHGLGMQSVQEFSNRIGGNIGCYCEDGMFHIMLFAKL